MPVYEVNFVSALMVIGSLYAYTQQIMDKTNGTDYKGFLFATELTWVGPWITSTVYLITNADWAWSFMMESLNQSIAGPLGYNWLALVWAQYQRSVNATTDFTASDNLVASAIALLWNLLNIPLMYRLVAGVIGYEYDFIDWYCSEVEDCEGYDNSDDTSAMRAIRRAINRKPAK